MVQSGKIKHFFRIFWRLLRTIIVLGGVILLAAGSTQPPGSLSSYVHAITRPIEFDFGTWTLDAVIAKLSNWALSMDKFISEDQQSEFVLTYLAQVQKVNTLNRQVLLMYADPEITDPEAKSQSLRMERDAEQKILYSQAFLAESILQAQLMSVIESNGLDILGQVLPPSLYRISEIPYSLIISPRTQIAQVLDISLEPGLETEQMEKLENEIYADLDHSALVVPIGGIGTYPTMVMQTTDIVRLTEVISHEWVHNFLTLRPLGINYYTTDALRTINETVASLAGKELGLMILREYYPEYVPKEVEESETNTPVPEIDPQTFNFRAEMRLTRVEVDRLLAQGDVEAAEQFMEQRRQFFWENGYLIRKLNQAYFSFYGAYNDQPGGGASGEDPIGPAVVTYRDQFDTLAGFLNAVSWIDSYEGLLIKLGQ